MYKFGLSVRAYNEGRKFGLPHFEDWHKTPENVMRLACIEAGKLVLQHHRGKKTAIELFRAGGLGALNIINAIPDFDANRIHELCEKYDYTLHNW